MYSVLPIVRVDILIKSNDFRAMTNEKFLQKKTKVSSKSKTTHAKLKPRATQDECVDILGFKSKRNFTIYSGLFYQLLMYDEWYLNVDEVYLSCSSRPLLSYTYEEGSGWLLQRVSTKYFVLRNKLYPNGVVQLETIKTNTSDLSCETCVMYLATLEEDVDNVAKCLDKVYNWKCHFQIIGYDKSSFSIKTEKGTLGFVKEKKHLTEVIGVTTETVHFTAFVEEIQAVEVYTNFQIPKQDEFSNPMESSMENEYVSKKRVFGTHGSWINTSVSVIAEARSSLIVKYERKILGKENDNLKFKYHGVETFSNFIIGQLFLQTEVPFETITSDAENNEITIKSNREFESAYTIRIPPGVNIEYAVMITFQRGNRIQYEVELELRAYAETLCLRNDYWEVENQTIPIKILKPAFEKGSLGTNYEKNSVEFLKDHIKLIRSGYFTPDIARGLFLKVLEIETNETTVWCK